MRAGPLVQAARRAEYRAPAPLWHQGAPSGREMYAFVEGDSGPGAWRRRLLPLSSPAPAQTALRGSGLSQAGFQAYLPQLEAQAPARRGQPRDDRPASSRPSSSARRTVELDRAQPGGPPGSTANPPFAPYRARHVTPALIAGGQRRYAANLPRLSEIGRRYGVAAVGPGRDLGPRDQLRRGHRQFRPSQLARQPRL